MSLSRRLKKLFSPLKNNRGSTVVIVMLTMLFVATLGGTLLYMSYTSVLVRSSEQHGVQNFYDASALMDEIQGGFQTVASGAVAGAYQASLENGADITIFNDTFVQNVLGYTIGSSTPVNLVSQPAAGVYNYNLNAISLLLQQAGVSSDDIYISGVSGEESDPIHLSGSGEIVQKADALSFKGLSVTYFDPETRHGTTVSADILLNHPEFNMPLDQSVELNFTGLPNFAIVAGNTLTMNNTNSFVSGSAYGGNVVLQGANTTTLQEGMLISSGNITTEVGHTLSVLEDAQLWSRELTLQNTSTFDLLGSAYLLDDLALQGDNTTAILRGNYYGFGNDLTSPELSSSIVINGLNANLDLSQSNQLMLAGHSFITVANSGVMMGESVSVRPNQMAYLIPTDFLEAAPGEDDLKGNPMIIDMDEEAPQQILTADSIWTIGSEDKYLLTDYGADVQTMIYPLRGTDQRAAYYFLKFDTVENANKYFRDYFSVRGGDITKYLDLYADLSDVEGYVQTSGNYIIEETDDNYTLPEMSTVNPLDDGAVQSMHDVYNNLYRTLSNMAPSDSSVANPYDYIVDTAAVRAHAGDFLDKDGNVIAIVRDGNYSINASTPSTARFILATGDISISGDFTGFALAGGNITVGGVDVNISSSPDDVRAAFIAQNGGVALSELLNISDDLAWSGSGDGQNPWNMSDIVGYENWKES